MMALADSETGTDTSSAVGGADERIEDAVMKKEKDKKEGAKVQDKFQVYEQEAMRTEENAELVVKMEEDEPIIEVPNAVLVFGRVASRARSFKSSCSTQRASSPDPEQVPSKPVAYLNYFHIA